MQRIDHCPQLFTHPSFLFHSLCNGGVVCLLQIDRRYALLWLTSRKLRLAGFCVSEFLLTLAGLSIGPACAHRQRQPFMAGHTGTNYF
jgi:hypothetical protein